MKKSRERFVNHIYGLIAGTVVVGIVAPIVSLSLGAITSNSQIANIVFGSVTAVVNTGYLVIKILETRWRENDE